MEEEIHELIRDILDYSPRDDKYTLVAKLGTIQNKGIRSTQDFNTALISPHLIKRIKPSQINSFIKSANPTHTQDLSSKTTFHVFLSPANGLKKAEPLVVGWESENRILLTPDQSFLGTYSLIPRNIEDLVIWDDLSRPEFDVLINKPKSHYDNSEYSEAYVKINKSYFIDYLERREKAGVQVFQEIRWIERNVIVDKILGNKNYRIYEGKDFELRMKHQPNVNELVYLEVNGFRVLHNPLTGSKNSSIKEEDLGHYWKGRKELVTPIESRHYSIHEYCYVSDDVLAKYEQDDNYIVDARSGSISYGNQWSVSYCDRVGRDTIRIELKKLYQGTPYEVIDHWNKYSVLPVKLNTSDQNVAKRAERLVESYLRFGRLLAKSINTEFGLDYEPSDIISIEETSARHSDLLQYHSIRPITHHINPKSFSKSQFVARCKYLSAFLIEGLLERNLRKVIDLIGFDKQQTEKLKSLKLLALILKFLHIAQKTGLNPIDNRHEILSRFNEYTEFEHVKKLSALNQIRQLDAHRSNKSSNAKLQNALKILGISGSLISNNYSDATDQVYDELFTSFENLNEFLLNR